MKGILVSFLCVVCCALAGETKAPEATTERSRHLALDMEVLDIETLPADGLCITAQAKSGADQGALRIRIPGGKLTKGKRAPSGRSSHDFPVFLEPMAKGKDVLDQMLSTTLGKGAKVTIFKPRGYSGSAFDTPKDLGQKGGGLFLFDPGIDAGGDWYIAIELDVKKRALSILISESSY